MDPESQDGAVGQPNQHGTPPDYGYYQQPPPNVMPPPQPPGAPGQFGGYGGYGGPPYGHGGQYYATFWERVGAYLVDSFIISGIQFALYLVAILVALPFAFIGEAWAFGVGITVWVVTFVALMAWFILLEAKPFGQTPGKRIVGIRVVDTSGNTISRGSAVGRYFAKIISALPCYLGLLWPAWDQERRAFHDMMLNTRVIKVADAPPFKEVLLAPLRRRTGSQG